MDNEPDTSEDTQHQAEQVAVAPKSMINDSNAFGVASFVLGLVGVTMGLLVITFGLSFVLGLLALVFGLIGLRKPTRRAMSVWGSVLGVMSIAVGFLGGYLMLQLLGNVEERVDNLDRDFESVLNDAVEEIADEFEMVVDDQMNRVILQLEARDNNVERVVVRIIEERERLNEEQRNQ